LDTELRVAGKAIKLLHNVCIECSMIFHAGQVNKIASKIEEDERGLGDVGVARHIVNKTRTRKRGTKACGSSYQRTKIAKFSERTGAVPALLPFKSKCPLFFSMEGAMLYSKR
jgi:hypothetical protein